eukprot:scaffold2551_cov113-Cylindrotheca_fusiformis.AAC.30
MIDEKSPDDVCKVAERLTKHVNEVGELLSEDSIALEAIEELVAEIHSRLPPMSSLNLRKGSPTGINSSPSESVVDDSPVQPNVPHDKGTSVLDPRNLFPATSSESSSKLAEL